MDADLPLDAAVARLEAQAAVAAGAGAAAGTGVTKGDPNKPAILLLGDSVTAYGALPGGWSTRLAATYGDKWEIINEGVPMGNTRSFLHGYYANEAGRKRLDHGHQYPRVQLVTVCLGVNDATTHPGNSSYRWIPLDEFKANYIDGMRDLVFKRKRSVMLITPPPPAVPPRHDRRVDATAEYAQVVKDVAAQFRVPVADLFTAIQQVPDWRTTAILPDGLHLTATGQAVMYNLVLQTIRTFYPQIYPRAPAALAG